VGLNIAKSNSLSQELKYIIENKKVETRLIASPQKEKQLIETPQKTKQSIKDMVEPENLDAFSSEDEAEIKKISESMSQIKVGANNNFGGQVNQVFKRIGINFSSQFLLERFKKILKVNLSGIRDLDATLEILLKPFGQGGVGLEKEEANMVIDILRKAKLQTKEKLPKVVLDKPRPALSKAKPVKIARDIEYDLEKAILAKKAESPKKIKQPKLQIKSQGLKDGSLSPISKVKKITEDIHEVPKPQPVQEKNNKKPRTMGPIDELRYLNLVDFRRLHEEPAKAIIKVKEKISLLEKDKYEKKVEGLKAWRASPVNKMYLGIGQASIINHKSIQDVIHELGEKDSLSQEEFDAIGKLNYQLRTT